MTGVKIRDEKLQYDINRKVEKHYHPEKLINMNILQVKKLCFLIQKVL